MVAYLLYKLAYLLSVMLPLRMAYGLASFLSMIKYYLSPRDRKAVINNLRKILPSSEHKRINSYAKEVFVNFGKYLVEFFRLSFLKPEDLGQMVKIKGREHVDEALKKGKGVIIVAAHTGNWELGGVFMSLLGYPVVAVALPHRHKRVNTLFNRQRERSGVIVVSSLGVALRRIYEGLKGNKLVALLGDRDFGNNGRRMPFLGETKVLPRGPAILALRTGASIVPAFVIRQDDDTHVIEFLEPIRDSGDEQEIMSDYVKVIEKKIRRYPTQWLLFREFWKE